MKKALIYGDSLMKGIVYHPDTKRYTNEMDDLYARFSQEHHIEIVNRCRFGYTIEKGKRILDSDLSSGVRGDYALVEFGGNDCSFHWKEVSEQPQEKHDPLTAYDQFVLCYENIVDELKKSSVKPILMTLPPVDAEKMLDFLATNGLSKANIVKWLGDAQMVYRYHEKYSTAIRRIAAQTQSLLVDVRSYFLDICHYDRLICADGMHLSAEGQELVYRAFSDFAAGLA